MSKDSGIVDIHGKQYSTVAKRVNEFREKYKEDYAILTELISIDDNTVVMKASIAKGDFIVATGYAEEQRSSSQINKTSALENCETSAIGRALAAFGLAGTEYASADEVAQAISQQGGQQTVNYPFPTDKELSKPKLVGMATEKQRETIDKYLSSIGISKEEMKGYLISEYGVTTPLSKQAASDVIDMIFSTKPLQHA